MVSSVERLTVNLNMILDDCFRLSRLRLTPICELWTKNPQTGNMVERHLWTKNPHNFFLKNSKSIFLPSKTIQEKLPL